jgi:hypothetical protein
MELSGGGDDKNKYKLKYWQFTWKAKFVMYKNHNTDQSVFFTRERLGVTWLPSSASP